MDVWSSKPEALSPWPVLVLFLSTVAVTVALAILRLTDALVKKLFQSASLLLFVTYVVLGVMNLQLLQLAGAKLNFMDWECAAALACATFLAFLAAARLQRQGRPSPVAMFLAVGFTWACLREMHYGGDFLGEKVWWARNLVTPKSYLDVSYFERFRQTHGISTDAHTLYIIHIAATAVILVVSVLLAWYVLRRRSTVRAELRCFCRKLYGQLYILGVGLYIVAKLLGGLLHSMPSWAIFGEGPWQFDQWHTAVEQMVKCWGAVSILFCAVAMWQAARRVGQGGLLPSRPSG